MRRTLGASTTCNRCCLFASSFNATLGPLYSLSTDLEELCQLSDFTLRSDMVSLFIAPRKTPTRLKPRIGSQHIVDFEAKLHAKQKCLFLLFHARGGPEQASSVGAQTVFVGLFDHVCRLDTASSICCAV